jgi:hypothetical protein
MEIWLPITSNNVRHSSIQKLDPEHVKLGIGSSLLSRIQAETPVCVFLA